MAEQPKDLAARGAAFWQKVTADYDFNLSEAEVLLEVCRTLDLVDSLEADIKRDGSTVRGSAGSLKPHPAVVSILTARRLLSQLLSQLELPAEEAATSIATVHARRANEVRWQGHDKSLSQRNQRAGRVA